MRGAIHQQSEKLFSAPQRELRPANSPVLTLPSLITPQRWRDRLLAIIAWSFPLLMILNTFENNSKLGRIFFTGVILTCGAALWKIGELRLSAFKIPAAAAGLVLLTSLLSAIFSIDPSYSLETLSRQHLWYALLFIVTGAWAVTLERQRYLLLAAAAAGTVSAIVGLFLYYYHEQLQQAGIIEKAGDYIHRAMTADGQPYIRAKGTLESYTRSAMAQAIAIPAMTALFIPALRSRRWMEAALLALAAALSIWFMLLTKSRGAWIATGLGSVLVILMMGGRFWYTLAAGALICLPLALLPNVRERASTFFSDLDEPDLLLSGRLDLWGQGWEPIENHWLTGVGYGGNIFLTDEGIARYELMTDRRQPDLHNLYLQTLAEVGLLGSIAYLVFLAILCTGAWRLWRRHGREAPGVAAALGILAGVLISGVIYYMNEDPVAHILWPMLGLLAAGWADKDDSTGPE